MTQFPSVEKGIIVDILELYRKDRLTNNNLIGHKLLAIQLFSS